MSFQVIDAPNGVLHIQFDSRISMTTSMCRLDAYSESPLDNLRAKVSADWSIFLEFLLSEDPDYFTFWEGFNIPGIKVKDFFNIYPENTLSSVERRIKSLMVSKDYLIATDLTSTTETIAHELAHARWATDSAYKSSAMNVVNAIPLNLRAELDAGLVAYGYPQVTEILDDEIHAYLLTSDSKELQDVFPNMNINVVLNLSATFKVALSSY
jgi:hypothetical protein